MDRQTHLMINDAGYNAAEKSSWSSLAESLVGRAGQALQVLGPIVAGRATAAQHGSDATRYKALEDAYKRQSLWDETTAITAGLQREVIGYAATQERIASHDKWLSRIGSAKAGYAAAGVAVDVGSPLTITARLLQAQETELSTIATNERIRKWNEADLPVLISKNEALNSLHQANMARVDSEGLKQAARVTSTSTWLQAAGQVANIIGGFA